MCYLQVSEPLSAPSHLLPHSSLLFPRKSNSSPQRAVTQRKLFHTSHGCPWSNAAVTQESPDRLSFCPQRHSTSITGRLTTPQLCHNLGFSVWCLPASADGQGEAKEKGDEGTEEEKVQ
ncbi:Hypothetical predicted protein [Scomber scombrus]|uniref:Uncharacterized protein n=1 Tax=Scomber scombrus TaxID=13677 RepID=A0AAV1NLD6_SCOSC